jgi:hypothetical protein
MCALQILDAAKRRTHRCVAAQESCNLVNARGWLKA